MTGFLWQDSNLKGTEIYLLGTISASLSNVKCDTVITAYKTHLSCPQNDFKSRGVSYMSNEGVFQKLEPPKCILILCPKKRGTFVRVRRVITVRFFLSREGWNQQQKEEQEGDPAADVGEGER